MTPEDGIAERVAREAWRELEPAPGSRPAPERPACVVMVGVPLSGKSTVARAIAAEAVTDAIIVENDALRERVAFALGRVTPAFDGIENHLTYEAAGFLLRIALARGVNAIHDATNLNEKARKTAYAAADDAGARVIVVFVTTPREVMEARVAAAPEDRKRAFAVLGGKRPNPAACTRPHLVVSGSDVERAVGLVLSTAEGTPLVAADRTS